MSLQWLRDSVAAVIAVCAVSAILECAAENTASESGLRMVCGAVAASTVLKMLLGFLQEIS